MSWLDYLKIEMSRLENFIALNFKRMDIKGISFGLTEQVYHQLQKVVMKRTFKLLCNVSLSVSLNDQYTLHLIGYFQLITSLEMGH